jgi:hypothetical protein
MDPVFSTVLMVATDRFEDIAAPLANSLAQVWTELNLAIASLGTG